MQSFLLRAYVIVPKYPDSGVDDESLEISGYYLIRSDHAFNKKGSDICVYYKNFLTGVRLLEESIACDLIRSKKLCYFIALYRSPN